MAKRRVKRKRSTREKVVKKKQAKPAYVMTLACPNHMCSVTLAEDVSDEEARGCFPTMSLMLAEEDSGYPERLAFVDPMYGCRVSGDRGIYAPPYAPPTWMDPEVFVRLVKDMDEIKQIAAEAIKKKSRVPTKKMVPILQEKFEEYYIGYLLDRFDEVAPLLAHWLVAYHADQAEQKELTKKKPTKRKVKSNVNDSES